MQASWQRKVRWTYRLFRRTAGGCSALELVGGDGLAAEPGEFLVQSGLEPFERAFFAGLGADEHQAGPARAGAEPDGAGPRVAALDEALVQARGGEFGEEFQRGRVGVSARRDGIAGEEDRFGEELDDEPAFARRCGATFQVAHPDTPGRFSE